MSQKLFYRRLLATWVTGLGVVGTLWAAQPPATREPGASTQKPGASTRELSASRRNPATTRDEQPPRELPPADVSSSNRLGGLTPVERVVMLRNGETFQGVVTEAGDHLIITLPDGEISLKTSEVEAIFRTLDEGYLRQRNVLTPDAKADAHLDLAQWCLRHKLYERAAEEIEAARGADPRHPKIDFMQRKLKLVQEQPKAMVARTVSTATANDEPTNDDLDRFIRGVSTEAIETFAHSIQPLLLNNCTASSCHGPRSDTGLSLLRIQLGRTPSRRLTQRNLYAVCRFVDRENPNESPLLTQTIREHGAARAAIFTSRDMVQYKQLVGWVRMVAHAGGTSQPRSVRKDEQPLLQSVPADDNPRLQGVDKQNEQPSADEQEASGDIEQTTAESPVDEKESDDPFDAEIFNRRFGPKR